MKMGYLRLPGADLFMVNEKSLVKRIMVTEADKFPKHQHIEEVLKPLLGESIFTTNGEIWRKQRAMIDPAFSHTRLEKAFPLMNEAVQEMLERMLRQESGTENIIDVEMTHITADIIFRTILSAPLSAEDAQQIFSAFNEFQEAVQRITLLHAYRLPAYFQKKKSEKSAAKIRPILAKVIRKRYEDFQSGTDIENRDILSSLMHATDKESGKHFSYDELVDHICMLFLAGHETSASALTWSLYLVSECPDIQQKIYAEICEVTKGGEINFTHIKKLKFTFDVFREALRLYPPVGFFLRTASEDTCMRDREVKKDAMVMVSPWLIHRHQDQWKCPHQFMPERFAENDAKESLKSSYLPFGKGQRLCIGQGFANQEAVLILANLIRNFRFENPQGQIPEPLGRVTVRPRKAIKLIMHKR